MTMLNHSEPGLDRILEAEQIRNTQQQLNRDTVEEFREYMFRAPELRFWQALRNWSDYYFIYVSNLSPFVFQDYGNRPINTLDGQFEDTFYWKGRNRQ